MGCSLPFAAQAAMVQQQVQEGLELVIAWALRVGLLEVGQLVRFCPTFIHSAAH
jgi:hypothetical protein